ncbi:bifunctional glycosyltransferase family 2/GtrA family protein [Paraconexibacter algicola]|uniref:dolichyl-phosphate beta-glucosyltransferase n=1 Tax=Paraconexibacter algicola TaxID=2133960 RepID=A0A2T4UBQ7_9ACTN|nr:bifunctional glycosyltransferase family 2/GtrA family protein [Paraconexibacter algicola]PTL54342.1 sugar translocase [Paraconexibacter algicola]
MRSSSLATRSAPADRPAPVAPSTACVEIVVPVHNEQVTLAASVRRLHEHLTERFPFAWRIVVANNASTDRTAAVARALADDLPGVALLDLPEKGRGRALRAAWTRSDADVLCYMDVDLSTDLDALLPLVAPLVSGHSELAIGTRLSRSSRVVRGPKREVISRSYNQLLRWTLGARFSDAQCGFKAIRADVARELLPQVRDEAWFFDTELLVLAQREGRRIHEVPVDWVDDPDSRVDIVSTAMEDLRGIVRLLAAARLTRFLAVGVASTLAYVVLFLLLRSPLDAAGANAAALAITAVGNTQANRRFTFAIRGRHELVRQHLAGAIVFVLTLGLTSGALGVLHGLDAAPSRAVELLVLVAASVCATVTRYVALRTWVFAREGRRTVLRRAVGSIARVGL